MSSWGAGRKEKWREKIRKNKKKVGRKQLNKNREGRQDPRPLQEAQYRKWKKPRKGYNYKKLNFIIVF